MTTEEFIEKFNADVINSSTPSCSIYVRLPVYSSIEFVGYGPTKEEAFSDLIGSMRALANFIIKETDGL